MNLLIGIEILCVLGKVKFEPHHAVIIPVSAPHVVPAIPAALGPTDNFIEQKIVRRKLSTVLRRSRQKVADESVHMKDGSTGYDPILFIHKEQSEVFRETGMQVAQPGFRKHIPVTRLQPQHIE